MKKHLKITYLELDQQGKMFRACGTYHRKIPKPTPMQNVFTLLGVDHIA